MAVLIWSGTTEFTSAGSGSEEVITLKVPHRGDIKGYSLVAADGGATGNFTAGLYTSKQDKEPNSELPAAAFKVLSFDQSSASNASISVSYINRDGTPTNQQRYLYLRLTRSGGSKAFVFTITIDTPKTS
jgi:hypothetical protein